MCFCVCVCVMPHFLFSGLSSFSLFHDKNPRQNVQTGNKVDGIFFGKAFPVGNDYPRGRGGRRRSKAR